MEENGEIVTFAFFLAAGLFPPFSDSSWRCWVVPAPNGASIHERRPGARHLRAPLRVLHRGDAVGVRVPTIFPRDLAWRERRPMESVRFSVCNHHLYIEQGLSNKVDDWKRGWIYLSTGAARARLHFPRCMPVVVAGFWEQLLEKDARLEK